MEDGHSGIRRWEDMDIDIMVKIFESMNIIELTSGVGHVCRTWRMAACDSLLWKTLDLSLIRSNFIKIPLEPYVYVSARSDKLFNQILKTALSLSQGNVSTLIFHYNMYVNDEQLAYTADRSLQLKRLVMPAWNRIKKATICQAIRKWQYLESLTMPTILNPRYLIGAISRHCKNFSELKVMGPFDVVFASTLAAYLPNLKVLSLRCTLLFKDALMVLLNDMKSLEVLNISHCIVVEPPSGQTHRRVAVELDSSIFERACRLKQFLTCTSDECVMCERTRNDEGMIRWYKYEEDLWKFDEVSSLAI
ncbi:F-box/LRR-repeat protein At3g48880 isoform X2 [Andrographis paniculata]|nr:F-box/LRR-repeat protein At3g48880 isoform X2 [Andrographis paniculata]XP_051122935.1 F-box/LRR-repeat protein At3g48880 isoform X2 [Andrographis paniculata]